MPSSSLYLKTAGVNTVSVKFANEPCVVLSPTTQAQAPRPLASVAAMISRPRLLEQWLPPEQLYLHVQLHTNVIWGSKHTAHTDICVRKYFMRAR